MPFCQTTGTLDALEFAFHGGAEGPFFRALKNSNPPINVSELTLFATLHGRVGGFGQTLQVDWEWDKWKRSTEGLWRAAHCRSSTWVRATKRHTADDVENWLLNEALVLRDWGKSDDWGSGNLLMANTYMYRVVWHDLALSSQARAAFDELLYKHNHHFLGFLSQAFDSDTIIQNALSHARQIRLSEPDAGLDVPSFQQQRSLFGIIKFPGVLAAAALVLSAMLPVAKHVQTAGRMRAMHQRTFIVCHFALDMVLLISALSVSLVGPLAASFDSFVHEMSGT